MTISAQGPPAIVFDNVKVWASDDGFFQVVFGEDATEVQQEVKITRSDPGVDLKLSAYVARVAAMVVLRHASEGSDRDLALVKTREFIQEVVAFVSPGYTYDPEVADRSVTPQVGAVYDGHANYQTLVEQWPSLVGRLLREMDRRQLVAWN